MLTFSVPTDQNVFDCKKGGIIVYLGGVYGRHLFSDFGEVIYEK